MYQEKVMLMRPLLCDGRAEKTIVNSKRKYGLIREETTPQWEGGGQVRGSYASDVERKETLNKNT